MAVKGSLIEIEQHSTPKYLTRKLKPLDTLKMFCIVDSVEGNKVKLKICEIYDLCPNFQGSTANSSQHQIIEIDME